MRPGGREHGPLGAEAEATRYHEVVENDVLFGEAGRFTEDLARAMPEALRGVALFGSRVRGTHHPESDLDLFAVSDAFPISRPDRFRAIRPLLGAYPALLRHGTFLLLPTAASQTIQPFYLGLLDGCQILFERDGFMRHLLERTRRRLTELGSRKALDSRGHEYWILVPDDRYVPGMPVVV